MLLLFRADSIDSQAAPDASAPPPTIAKRFVRRGATAMEYLMVISLILVVAMIGVGYFGSMTSNVTQATSNAISKSVKKGG
jgi:Flp pilus assembly pilin Flp